jgi:hypothetical protein
MIVGIRHFIDPKPYEPFHLFPHVTSTIVGFSPQSDSQKSLGFTSEKAEPNTPIIVM